MSLWGPRSPAQQPNFATQFGIVQEPYALASPLLGPSPRVDGQTPNPGYEPVTADDVRRDLPMPAALRDSNAVTNSRYAAADEAYTASQVLFQAVQKAASLLIGTFLMLILLLFAIAFLFYGSEHMTDKAVDRLGGNVGDGFGGPGGPPAV